MQTCWFLPILLPFPFWVCVALLFFLKAPAEEGVSWAVTAWEKKHPCPAPPFPPASLNSSSHASLSPPSSNQPGLPTGSIFGVKKPRFSYRECLFLWPGRTTMPQSLVCEGRCPAGSVARAASSLCPALLHSPPDPAGHRSRGLPSVPGRECGMRDAG